MKLPYKVGLIVVGVVLLLSVLLTLAFGTTAEIFFVVLGTVCTLLGGLLIFVSIILHIASSREYGNAFLITAGILLIIGAGICGPMLAGVYT